MQKTTMAAIAFAAALTPSVLVLRPLLTRPATPGCESYTSVGQPLIAHGGGGLPDRSYANNLEALNLAAKHGFSLIEMDFMDVNGKLVIQHDGLPQSSLTVSGLMQWLDRHPGISIVTDVKTDNRSGLAMLKRAAGARVDRFIPQIYAVDEYKATSALGFQKPIFTVYRIASGQEPVAAINALDLQAVTMPVDRKALAERITHPVYLHTVNRPMPGYGLYTDCLVPT